MAYRVSSSSRASRIAAYAALALVAHRRTIARLRQPRAHPGFILHLHHAGAGAVVEPARRLRRLGLGRPASLCRHGRLRAVWRSDPAGLGPGAVDPARRAGSTGAGSAHRLLRLPLARRLLCHRHLGHRRSRALAGGAMARGRRWYWHLLAALSHQRHVGGGLDQSAVRRQDLGGARHPGVLAGAIAGAGDHRRDLLAIAAALRPGAGSGAR